MTNDEHVLTAQNLSMSFGGLVALDNVSLEVRKNAITALIGPNGAGKTTVFNCLTGFYRPTAGKLLFNPHGKQIDIIELLGGSWSGKDFFSPVCFAKRLYYKMFGGTHQIIRSGITRTFQNTRLFMEMTVLENLLVAQHRDISQNIVTDVLCLPSYRRAEQEALRTVYNYLDEFMLADVANRLAKELSYGQQKKLEIIRALCTKPTLICFDEPAAGLNSAETKELAKMISNISNKHGVSVFIIEHDMSLVMQISDYVIVLDSGAVIATGTPKQIKKDPRVLTAYLGTDFDEQQVE